jgi:hypothetical protein
MPKPFATSQIVMKNSHHSRAEAHPRETTIRITALRHPEERRSRVSKDARTALPSPNLQIILICEQTPEARMILHGLGPCLITRLLRAERGRDPETDWLLHGPTDPEVVEEERREAIVIRLAAE